MTPPPATPRGQGRPEFVTALSGLADPHGITPGAGYDRGATQRKPEHSTQWWQARDTIEQLTPDNPRPGSAVRAGLDMLSSTGSADDAHHALANVAESLVTKLAAATDTDVADVVARLRDDALPVGQTLPAAAELLHRSAQLDSVGGANHFVDGEIADIESGMRKAMGEAYRAEVDGLQRAMTSPDSDTPLPNGESIGAAGVAGGLERLEQIKIDRRDGYVDRYLLPSRSTDHGQQTGDDGARDHRRRAQRAPGAGRSGIGGR
jgi:hypothetical protein